MLCMQRPEGVELAQSCGAKILNIGINIFLKITFSILVTEALYPEVPNLNSVFSAGINNYY